MAALLLCGVGGAKAAELQPDTIVVHDTVYVMQVPVIQNVPVSVSNVNGQWRTSSTADSAVEALQLDARGQYVPSLWPVEGEIYYGGAFPLSSYERRSAVAGGQFGLEVRHNLREHPWSIGGGLGLYALSWESFHGDYDFNDTFGLQLFSSIERNFRRGSLFSPYVGGQVGLFLGATPESDLVTPYVNIKAGMEFFHTLRLNATTTLGPQYLCSVGLTLSIVIGGYPSR